MFLFMYKVDEVKSGSEGLSKLIEAATNLYIQAMADDGQVGSADSMSSTSEMTASDHIDGDNTAGSPLWVKTWFCVQLLCAIFAWCYNYCTVIFDVVLYTVVAIIAACLK